MFNPIETFKVSILHMKRYLNHCFWYGGLLYRVCCIYEVENRPPLNLSLNNSVTRPSFKNLYDLFFYQ